MPHPSIFTQSIFIQAIFIQGRPDDLIVKALLVEVADRDNDVRTRMIERNEPPTIPGVDSGRMLAQRQSVRFDRLDGIECNGAKRGDDRWIEQLDLTGEEV